MKRSIVRDPVHPEDFAKLNLIYCCEQCSYYLEGEKLCNIGFYMKPHTQEEQLKSYHLTGRMALCRFIEID